MNQHNDPLDVKIVLKEARNDAEMHIALAELNANRAFIRKSLKYKYLHRIIPIMLVFIGR